VDQHCLVREWTAECGVVLFNLDVLGGGICEGDGFQGVVVAYIVEILLREFGEVASLRLADGAW